MTGHPPAPPIRQQASVDGISPCPDVVNPALLAIVRLLARQAALELFEQPPDSDGTEAPTPLERPGE